MMPTIKDSLYGINTLDYNNLQYRIGPVCMTIHNNDSDIARAYIYIKNIINYVDTDHFYPLLLLYCHSGR